LSGTEAADSFLTDYRRPAPGFGAIPVQTGIYLAKDVPIRTAADFHDRLISREHFCRPML
jgi:hypothetical protein